MKNPIILIPFLILIILGINGCELWDDKSERIHGVYNNKFSFHNEIIELEIFNSIFCIRMIKTNGSNYGTNFEIYGEYEISERWDKNKSIMLKTNDGEKFIVGFKDYKSDVGFQKVIFLRLEEDENGILNPIWMEKVL